MSKNFSLAIGYPRIRGETKKRELVVSFALKQVSANTYARCGQKNNHPTLAYMHKQERSETIPNAYKQNERYIVFILLLMKFCRFRFKDKQKRFSEDPHRLRTLQR